MIEFECVCTMGRHKAPLEGYEISRGALDKLPCILSEYNNIFIVADENTYDAAGRDAERILARCGKLSGSIVLHGKVLPDAKSIGDILIHINKPDMQTDIFAYSPLPDFILAVGSGTINDCCRLVAYRLGIPYGVAGTAPSMDGYFSAGSPFIFDGSKATIQCTTPKYVIADTRIMSEAPFPMLLAGIGDMFGKYTGILDWELARDYNGDYFCEKIAEDVMAATDKCLENGYQLTERSPEVIGDIMKGFMVTGLGMAFTGNSRPASGSEHIIAHSWELDEISGGKELSLHGILVCEAERLVANIYRILFKETGDRHLKSLIGKYIPYFDKVEEFCGKMNMPVPVKDENTIIQSIHHALSMRDRYTVLFYLRDNKLLDEYARRATQMLLGSAK